ACLQTAQVSRLDCIIEQCSIADPNLLAENHEGIGRHVDLSHGTPDIATEAYVGSCSSRAVGVDGALECDDLTCVQLELCPRRVVDDHVGTRGAVLDAIDEDTAESGDRASHCGHSSGTLDTREIDRAVAREQQRGCSCTD